MRSQFATGGGQRGSIDVVYAEPRPPAHEGPFLREERALLDSLARMIGFFLERRLARDSIQRAYRDVESKFRERARALTMTNRAMRAEIRERRAAEKKIKRYQEQLKRLASELSLTEDRERRAIARDLHDHVGQALALIKMKFLQLHCNSELCRFQDAIEELRVLLDRTIQDIRSLTFEISPPVLYELGLMAAVQWLAEQVQDKSPVTVHVTTEGDERPLRDEVKVTLFKGVRELLHNAVKHGPVSLAWVRLAWSQDAVAVEVRDDGPGFDTSRLLAGGPRRSSFGLFSLRERVGSLGGRLEIESLPGQGTRALLSVPLENHDGRHGP
jgi:signal transduction histidine kinase